MRKKPGLTQAMNLEGGPRYLGGGSPKRAWSSKSPTERQEYLNKKDAQKWSESKRASFSKKVTGNPNGNKSYSTWEKRVRSSGIKRLQTDGDRAGYFKKPGTKKMSPFRL